MKKLLTVTLLLLCALSITFAQVSPTKSDATIEDYERYIDKKLEMNFRLSAMDAINLTAEEINVFNPVFDNYIKAKDRLSEKKFKILEKYTEEMEDEEDADDQAEETSDMIEDYWETEIAEMELKKDYYDILENKIPFQKAIDFFLYEETVENNMKYDILVPTMPSVVKIEKRKKERKLKKMKANKPQQVAAKDWNRYIDKRLEMNFRLAAMEEMYLTPAEIKVFNPLFDEYMDAKEKMTEKKFAIIDRYAKKISKEDDLKDRTEEMSDFIEDYWEAEIKSMKVKEKYFDKMENKLPYMKVAQFFLLEETIENRLKYDAMIGKMPTIIIIDQKMQKVRDGDKKDTSMNNVGTKMMDSSVATRAEHKTETAMTKTTTAVENTKKEVEQTAKEWDAKEKSVTNSSMSSNKKSGNHTPSDAHWNAKENSTANSSMSDKEKLENHTSTDAHWSTKKSTSTNQVNTSSAQDLGAKENKMSTKTTTDKNATNHTKSTKVAFSNEITTFDNWVNSTRGQMSLSHDYTSNGLKAVVAAIESTVKATNSTVADWETKKATILNVANQITIDPKSNMHADWVSEAFVTIGSVVKTLNDTNAYTYAGGQVALLQHHANQIKPEVLLLKQSTTVYEFFGTANQALKDIWGYAAKSTAATSISAAGEE